MTYDEYCLLPDDGKRYQVIEGELTVSPSPSFRHQDTVWRLGKLLREFAEAHKLGVVVGAPMDVILEPNTIVQPDLLFIRSDHLEISRDKWRSDRFPNLRPIRLRLIRPALRCRSLC